MRIKKKHQAKTSSQKWRSWRAQLQQCVLHNLRCSSLSCAGTAPALPSCPQAPMPCGWCPCFAPRPQKIEHYYLHCCAVRGKDFLTWTIKTKARRVHCSIGNAAARAQHPSTAWQRQAVAEHSLLSSTRWCPPAVFQWQNDRLGQKGPAGPKQEL